MDLWLVRHGEGVLAMDGPLTELGEEQARCVATALADARLTTLISSPLFRAPGTAGIVAEALDLPIAVWPELREGTDDEYGAYSIDKLAARFPGAVIAAAGAWPETYGGDTYEGFYARAGAVRGRLQAELHAGDRV